MPSTLDADNDVPELIEKAAARAGSMAELARRVGVPQGSLAAIVERRKRLGPTLARKLAPHIGLTQSSLLIKAGWLTDQDDGESIALQRIRVALEGADADTAEEIAEIAETIVKRHKKGGSATSTRARPASRKT